MRKVFSLNPVSHKGYSIIAFFCAITLFFSPLVVLAEETILPEVVEPQVTIVEEVQEEVPAVEEPIITPEIVEEETVAAPEITEDETVEEDIATTTETIIEEEPATSTENSEFLDLILNATTTATSSLNLFEDESSENTQGTTTVSESTPELMESEEDAATSTEPFVEEVKETALVSEVLTPTGYKNISDLTIGDEVVGYDFGTGEKVTNVIEKVELITPVHFNYWEQDEEGSYTNYIEVPFTSYKVNGHYSLFKDQSVFANGRVIHASQLSVGDIFYTIDGEEVTIETVEEEVSSDQWVKLSVSGNHTYVAGDMILHNASRYWVGGGSSTNWSATGNTNWGSVSNTRDNASVPGASDDVIFDGVGFGASDSRLSASITINSLDMTGYANTLIHEASDMLTIAGSKLKLGSGMTYSLLNPSSSAITLTSTTGTVGSPTIISNAGKTMGSVTVSGLGGYFILEDDFFSEGILTLGAGTFDANGHNVSIGSFSSSNSNVRTLTVGNGTWNLTGSNTTSVNFTTITNFNFTTRPTFNLTSTSTVGSRTITSSLLPENVAPDINVTAGSDAITISNSYVGNLDFTGFSGVLNSHTRTVYGDLILGTGMTVILGTNTTTMGGTAGTKNIVSNGVTFNQNLTINGVGGVFQLGDDLTLDSSRTLSLFTGTFDANGHDVSIGNIFSSGAGVRTLTVGNGTWNLTGSNVTLVNFTTITNFTITTRPTFNLTSATSTGTRTVITSTLPESVTPHINVTAGSDAILISNSSVANLDFSGFSGTFNNAARIIYGDLTLSPTMTLAAGNSATTFGATSGVQTIISQGRVLDFPVTINGIGGTVQLGDNFSLGTTRTLLLTNGIFDANDHDVSVGIFSSSGSNVRTLTAGNGTWNITGSGTTIWNTSTVTNLTLTSKPTINLTYAGSVGTRIVGIGVGLAESVVPNFNITAGTDSITLSSLTAGSLDFTGFSGTLNSHTRTVLGNLTFSPTMTVAPGTTITTLGGTSGTSILTTNGLALDINLTVNGVGGVVQLADDLVMGSARTLTLTGGTLDANNKNVTVGIFSSSGSTIRTLSAGSGVWNLTGNSTTVLNFSVITNLTLTTRPTFNFTYSGSVGTRIASSVLTENDAPNINITAGTDSITVSNGSYGSLNFTGFSGNLNNGPRILFGDFILANGMTVLGGINTTTMRGTGTFGEASILDAKGMLLDFPISINGVAGTVQLADDLILGSTRTLALFNGTFDANDKNVTIGSFLSSNSNTRTVKMGSGTWTIKGTSVVWDTSIQTGLTLLPQSSTLVLDGANQSIAGSNTFNNLTKSASSRDVLFFEAGSTQYIVGTLLLSGASSTDSLLLRTETFGARTDYQTFALPRTVVAEDLNGDGRKDLIVGASSTVSIFIGNTDGTFSAKVDYPTVYARSPRSIAAGDITGDGKVDVTYAGEQAGGVVVLVNNGDGTFAPATQLFTCAEACLGTTLGDVNSDEKLDIILANWSNGSISIAFGNGDGTFAALADYAVLDNPRKVSVADLNGDGKVDLTVSADSVSGVSVLMNNGDGTFASKVDYFQPDGGAVYNRSLTTVDVNDDDAVDILIAAHTAMFVLLNNGDGTFGPHATYTTGPFNEDVAVMDVEGDGDLDALVTSNSGTYLGARVFLNDGTGIFTAAALYSTPSGANTQMITMSDLDIDGYADMIVANEGVNTVSVWLNMNGQQWNINPQGEIDLENIHVRNSYNTNPRPIEAFNFSNVTDGGNNTNWYFTPPTVAAPVSSGRTSTVTGGSSAVVRSLPDSFITSTPEGLQIAPSETKIIENITQNPIQPRYTFTENAFDEVTEDVDITYSESPQSFEEVEVNTVESVKNVPTTTFVETEEVSDSENIFVELGVGVLALILIVFALFRRRILNLR